MATQRDPAAAEPADVGPASAVSALDEAEVAALRQVGERWRAAVADRRDRLWALPVDPSAPRFPREEPAPRRRRFAPVEFVAGDEPGEVEATWEATAGGSRLQRAGALLRWLLLGPPLTSSAVTTERMRKLIALPVLASDALSSVAYGPEAMLAVLVLAGASGLNLSLPLAGVIAAMMLAVGLSYRQIIRAYPHGGGSYVVAGATLGEVAALVAAAGLLIDYVLTVAVSIAAGVAAATSAIPSLSGDIVPLGLGVIALLLLGNLRGVREAGTVFSIPTYAFIVAMAMLIVGGLVDAAGRNFARIQPHGVQPVQALTLLLVLRAFSSGATAMTGVEAVSNAVPAFKPPEARNARIVLSVMIALLITMFAGLVVVLHLDGIVPGGNQTVLSRLAHRTYGSGVVYAFIQAATGAVLLLAANTAFNGFPRLLSFMARKGHAPRFFVRLGDRLVFSNGMLLLATSSALIFAGFGGHVNTLIPLYAVGVFVAFTLAQSGMVVHWWRRRDPGWRVSLAINAVGATLSALVFVTAGVTKFTQGAWLALLLVAVLVLASWRIRRHYLSVRAALALPSTPAGTARVVSLPRIDREAEDPRHAAEVAERTAVTPDRMRQLVIVPVARLDLSSLRALAFAASLSQPVLGLHISPNDEEADRFRAYWHAWGDHVPLQVVVSPYRAVVAPLARYVVALHRQRPELTLTVVLPDLVVRHAWQRPLHNGMPGRIRRELRQEPNSVVAAVPFHLPD